MGSAIEVLRARYAGVKRGEDDVLVVRDAVRRALDDAKGHRDDALLEELEDMLIDLELPIDDDKCKCHSHKPNSIS
jgi:hypothetical protein